ncbi:MAG TPA: Flp pilus assembly protein CpaB [Desulfobaccales bacterium]
MGIAVVAGLVATFAVSRYVAHKTYVPPVITAKVAVAASEIAPGNALAAGAIKMVSWPKELVPPQAASASSQVEGRVATSSISTGEPILFSKLAPVGTAAGLSSLLNEQMRAMTVRVDDVSGVAGFIHPQDRVDVLVDMKMRGVDESFSKTILQNIMVMSAGQTWVQKDSKPVVVNTVTLEVTPEQAELLNLASSEGKIRLALRSRRNEQTPETAGVITSALFAGLKKPEPPKKVEKEEKEERSVEVIKGMERNKSKL